MDDSLLRLWKTGGNFLKHNAEEDDEPDVSNHR